MTNIIKYNTAGCSLIRKQVGLSAQNFVKEGLKGIKFPAGAVSYDVAKIGRKFNANEFFTDIFTFKDENGKILQRLTKEVNGAETKQTLKWYKYLFECDSDNDENILLNGRKTSGYERINGRISRIWDEVITKTNTKSPTVTIFKRESNGEHELHRLSQLKKGKKTKFIENIYNLFITLSYDNKKLAGIGKYELASSETSSKSLQKIAQHPYIFPFMSKYNKFIHRMFGAIDADTKPILTPELKLYSKNSSEMGFYNTSEGMNGTIHINKLDYVGKKRPRESLTNTIAHEFGHHNWEERTINYELGEDLESLGISKKDAMLLKKYFESMKNYISAEENQEEYYAQFAERAARVAGREATKKYNNLSKKIDKEFPFKHPEQFYLLSEEGNDSIEDLFILLDSFGESYNDLHNAEKVNPFIRPKKK